MFCWISCEEASYSEDPVLVTTGENTLTWRRCVSRVAALLVVWVTATCRRKVRTSFRGSSLLHPVPGSCSSTTSTSCRWL